MLIKVVSFWLPMSLMFLQQWHWTQTNQGVTNLPSPPWLCVLSNVRQSTSASLQPSASGLAPSPASLPQWDLMDFHQEAVKQATILGLSLLSLGIAYRLVTLPTINVFSFFFFWTTMTKLYWSRYKTGGGSVEGVCMQLFGKKKKVLLVVFENFGPRLLFSECLVWRCLEEQPVTHSSLIFYWQCFVL